MIIANTSRKRILGLLENYDLDIIVFTDDVQTYYLINEQDAKQLLTKGDYNLVDLNEELFSSLPKPRKT